MTEAAGAKPQEKPTRSGLKPERKRLVRKELTAARRGATAHEMAEEQAKGGGILEQRAAVRSVSGDGLVSRAPAPAHSSAGSRFGVDFSRVPTQTVAPPARPVVQAQLTVNAPGDQYEQDADRVAEQVMTMTPVACRLPVQRLEDEPALGPLVHRQADAGFRAHPSLEGRLAARQGGGRPLSAEARSFMESRFGADFSGVRIHTDSEAVRMTRELSAQAFTQGSDVYFEAGRYDPGTTAGKRLLAHELTHVVQQTGGYGIQTSGRTSINDPAEREARSMAQAVLGVGPMPPISESLSPSLVAGDWENPEWSIEYLRRSKLLIARQRGDVSPEASLTSRQVERGLGLPRNSVVPHPARDLPEWQLAFRIADRFIIRGVVDYRIQQALLRAGVLEAVEEEVSAFVSRVSGAPRTYRYNDWGAYFDHYRHALFVEGGPDINDQPTRTLFLRAQNLDRGLRDPVERASSFRAGGPFILRAKARVLIRIYDSLGARPREQGPPQHEGLAGVLARGTAMSVPSDWRMLPPFHRRSHWDQYAAISITPPDPIRISRAVIIVDEPDVIEVPRPGQETRTDYRIEAVGLEWGELVRETAPASPPPVSYMQPGGCYVQMGNALAMRLAGVGDYRGVPSHFYVSLRSGVRRCIDQRQPRDASVSVIMSAQVTVRRVGPTGPRRISVGSVTWRRDPRVTPPVPRPGEPGERIQWRQSIQAMLARVISVDTVSGLTGYPNPIGDLISAAQHLAEVRGRGEFHDRVRGFWARFGYGHPYGPPSEYAAPPAKLSAYTIGWEGGRRARARVYPRLWVQLYRAWTAGTATEQERAAAAYMMEHERYRYQVIQRRIQRLYRTTADQVALYRECVAE